MSTTTNTGLNQPAYNSTSPTWDQPLNFNETILDAVLGNTTYVAMPTGASATTTLTGPTSTGSLGQTQAMRITLTGSLSANQILQFPSGVAGKWIIYNTTSGSFSVTVSSAGGGTAVSAPQGYNVSIYSDGTNIRYTDDGLTNNFATLTVLGNTYLATTSGNVGIGTTSPRNIGAGYAGLTLNGINSGFIDINCNGTRVLTIAGATADCNFVNPTGSGAMTFGTNGAEKMRIDSSGNVGINETAPPQKLSVSNGSLNVSGGQLIAGATSVYSDGTIGTPSFQFNAIAGTSVGAICIANSTDDLGAIYFRNPNGFVGNISTSGSNTTYTTTSDYRLKENIVPMADALSVVAQLKPVTYTWKVDGSSGQGFIAHELQAVVPEAVTGEKDAVDADGNPHHQSIDTSFLVATLTAACQEQQKLIVDLQERLAKAGL